MPKIKKVRPLKKAKIKIKEIHKPQESELEESVELSEDSQFEEFTSTGSTSAPVLESGQVSQERPQDQSAEPSSSDSETTSFQLYNPNQSTEDTAGRYRPTQISPTIEQSSDIQEPTLRQSSSLQQNEELARMRGEGKEKDYTKSEIKSERPTRRARHPWERE
ncbi:hypothetical protein CMI47_12575 [Candidatus Pacearchaeota archaeon]|nr:hypothetical protein [Candidatus Pacearchaeota archaeon]